MPKFCTKCGAKLEGEDKFCGECGQKTPLPGVVPVQKNFGSAPIDIKKISTLSASQPHSSPDTPVVLPQDWYEAFTEEGYKYYYNGVTGESSWEIPTGKEKPKPASFTVQTQQQPQEPHREGSGGLLKWLATAKEKLEEEAKALASTKVERKEKESEKFPSSPPSNTGNLYWSARPSAETEEEKKKRVEEEAKKKEATAKAAERRKKEAAEEEKYIKSNTTTKQLQEVEQRRKQTESVAERFDPISCTCVFNVTGFEIKLKSNNKPDYVVYKIEVRFGQFSWVVWRRWKQVTQMDDLFRRDAHGYVPNLEGEGKDSTTKFEKGFLEERKRYLANYMQILAGTTARQAIFGNKLCAGMLVRFITPTQYGDEKPLGMIIPFKIEEYL